MKKLLATLALLFAPLARATPIVAGDFGLPFGGTTTPTCTYAQRNARTGPCSGLSNPFTPKSSAVVTDPSGSSCSAAGDPGNADILCLYDVVTSTWYNPATQGGGPHTHPTEDVDYMFAAPTTHKLYWDTDNDNVIDATEKEIDEPQYDEIIDIGDTVRYPTSKDALLALQNSLLPWENGTDLERSLLWTGTRTFLNSDCKAQAGGTERVCLYFGKVTSVDSNGAVPDCAVDFWNPGFLNVRMENLTMTFDHRGQNMLTTDWMIGGGPICGFVNGTATSVVYAARVGVRIKMSGSAGLINGYKVDSGWNAGRIPVLYQAGKSSNTTSVILRNTESSFDATDVNWYLAASEDLDDVCYMGTSDYGAGTYGRGTFASCGTSVFVNGSGGPSRWLKGTYIGGSGQGTAVAIGNENGTMVMANPNCIREQSPISIAGACDGIRPDGIGGVDTHTVDMSGATIEGQASGPLVSVVGAHGMTWNEMYFEQSAAPDGQGDLYPFQGQLIFGAGFRSDSGLPCSRDPDGGGPITCLAPDDTLNGGTSIYEDDINGVKIQGLFTATFGIGPGADSPGQTGTLKQDDDARPGLTIEGMLFAGGASYFYGCTGPNQPDLCCSGAGTEDNPGDCPYFISTNPNAKIWVDVSKLADDHYSRLMKPANYTGRFTTSLSDRLGLGSPTYGDLISYSSNPFGQSIAGNQGDALNPGAITVTRVVNPATVTSTRIPDELRIGIATEFLGGDVNNATLPTIWGSNLSNSGLWELRRAGGSTDVQMRWGSPSIYGWVDWPNLKGMGFGTGVASFSTTAGTAEVCAAGKAFVGYSGSPLAFGFCNPATGLFAGFGSGTGPASELNDLRVLTTGMTSNTVPVGTATAGIAAYLALPTNGTNGCDGAGQALQYNTTTRAFDCLTGISTGGTVNSIAGDTGTATNIAAPTITGGTNGIDTITVTQSTVRIDVDSLETGFLTNSGAGPLGCGAATQGKATVLANGTFSYCDGTGGSAVVRNAALGADGTGGTTAGDALGINAGAVAQLADIATGLKSGSSGTKLATTSAGSGTANDICTWTSGGDIQRLAGVTMSISGQTITIDKNDAADVTYLFTNTGAGKAAISIKDPGSPFRFNELKRNGADFAAPAASDTCSFGFVNSVLSKHCRNAGGTDEGIATVESGAAFVAGASAQDVLSGGATPPTIGANACDTTPQVVTATGVVATDVVTWTPDADWSTLAGFQPSSSVGAVTVYVFPGTNTVTFKVCNLTGSPIATARARVNWKVVR